MFYHLEILLGIFHCFKPFGLIMSSFILNSSNGCSSVSLVLLQVSLPVKGKIFLPTVAKCNLVVSTVAWYKPRQGL